MMKYRIMGRTSWNVEDGDGDGVRSGTVESGLDNTQNIGTPGVWIVGGFYILQFPQ